MIVVLGVICLIFHTAYLAYFVSSVVLAEGILFTVFELVISVESFIFLALLLLSLMMSTVWGTGKNF